MNLLGVGLRRAREGFDGWLKRAAGGDTACAGRVPSSCCVEGWGGVSGEWWCWVEREYTCRPGWKSETDMDSWVSEKEMTRDEGCHIARTAYRSIPGEWSPRGARRTAPSLTSAQRVAARRRQRQRWQQAL